MTGSTNGSGVFPFFGVSTLPEARVRAVLENLGCPPWLCTHFMVNLRHTLGVIFFLKLFNLFLKRKEPGTPAPKHADAHRHGNISA